MQYATTEEVADHYRTSPSTVRYWRHIGIGPRGVKVGKRVLYPASELERYDAELKAAAADDNNRAAAVHHAAAIGASAARNAVRDTWRAEASPMT